MCEEDQLRPQVQCRSPFRCRGNRLSTTLGPYPQCEKRGDRPRINRPDGEQRCRTARVPPSEPAPAWRSSAGRGLLHRGKGGPRWNRAARHAGRPPGRSTHPSQPEGGQRRPQVLPPQARPLHVACSLLPPLRRGDAMRQRSTNTPAEQAHWDRLLAEYRPHMKPEQWSLICMWVCITLRRLPATNQRTMESMRSTLTTFAHWAHLIRCMPLDDRILDAAHIEAFAARRQPRAARAVRAVLRNIARNSIPNWNGGARPSLPTPPPSAGMWTT